MNKMLPSDEIKNLDAIQDSLRRIIDRNDIPEKSELYRIWSDLRLFVNSAKREYKISRNNKIILKNK